MADHIDTSRYNSLKAKIMRGPEPRAVFTFVVRMNLLVYGFLTLVSLLQLEFKSALLLFTWSIHRLTQTGVYTPGGLLDQLKIDWRKPNDYSAANIRKLKSDFDRFKSEFQERTGHPFA